MSINLHCKGCGIVVAVLEEGSKTRTSGIACRCGICETEVTNMLSNFASMLNTKSSNNKNPFKDTFANIFGSEDNWRMK